MLRLAAALFLGSALGAAVPISGGVAGAFTALSLAVWTATVLVASRPPSRALACARRAALYLVIAAAASARAARPVESLATGQASLWLTARHRGPLELGALGVWRTERELGERSAGRIGSSAQRYLVAAGSLRDGELVALLSDAEPAAWARGPEPGPRSGAGMRPWSAQRTVAGDPSPHVEADESDSDALPDAALRISDGTENPPLEIEPDEIVRLARVEPTPSTWAGAQLRGAREWMLARLSRSGTPLACGLVRALLLGDLSELPPGTGDLFVRTGTFHVLAVSGMQVGLVALWIVWPLGSALAAASRALSRGRAAIPAPILRAVLLTLFVPLAGAEAPVVRAALAYALGSLATLIPCPRPIARITGAALTGDGAHGPRAIRAVRRVDTLSLWSLALAVECFLHPHAPLSLSVTLSYAATLGLILATGPFLGLTRAWLPNDGRIAAVGATGRERPRVLRIPVQAACDTLLRGVAASLAAVLATLPCVWARFGEWSAVGILATPLLLAPIAGLLGLGALKIFLPMSAVDAALEPLTRVTLGLLEICDRVPGSPAPLPPRPTAFVVAAVVLALAWVIARSRAGVDPRTVRRLARAASLAWAILLLPWNVAPRALELWALDVGSGTAVLLRAPGLGTWLFDAGSRDRPDVAREAVAPLLRRLDVARLGVVLSHADRDHDSALPWLIERYPPAVWAGALPAGCASRLPRDALTLDLDAGRLALPRLENASSTGLLELVRGSAVEGNEGSRSLAVRWQGERLLLCGDAEADGLAAWLHTDPPDRNLRLLLMPHHGSETDLLGALLARTDPAEAWISGTRHPTIARELDRRRLAWRWTARDGPLHLELPLECGSGALSRP